MKENISPTSKEGAGGGNKGNARNIIKYDRMVEADIAPLLQWSRVAYSS